VPLDGFSFAEKMFVFFSTDHFANGKVMGRCVLTRCTEDQLDFASSNANAPLQFQYLTSFSDLKFINVSVEKVNREVIQRYHLPGQEEGLLIWGTGAYRADNIYLAYLPLDDPQTRDNLLASGALPVSQLGLRYFTGERGAPQWSVREEEAVPLFYPAAIGELSVRWNAALERWVCMYMPGPEDPIGLAVVMRVARNPWGPWSRRRLVLDWWLDGLGHRTGAAGQRLKDGWFIHDGDVQDGLGDNIIDNRQGNGGGGVYAPYQLPRHTQRSANGVKLYYLLSTWNPYQVMQMRHEMSFRDLAALG
jgi:hypothetical protein